MSQSPFISLCPVNVRGIGCFSISTLWLQKTKHHLTVDSNLAIWRVVYVFLLALWLCNTDFAVGDTNRHALGSRLVTVCICFVIAACATQCCVALSVMAGWLIQLLY